jgi:SAM-dependent methyltransferase
MNTIQTRTEVFLNAKEAFEVFMRELSWELGRSALSFELKEGAPILEGGARGGRVVAFRPPEGVVLEWTLAEWKGGGAARVEFGVSDAGPGRASITLSVEGPKDSAEESTAWFATQIAAPIVRAVGPSALGDWVTDRRARRPSGGAARQTYRDPAYHRPNFRAILEVLQLQKGDYLLEVGCGEGAFLNQVLKTACRAAAVDHSPEMVDLATEVNSLAVVEGRLEVKRADAGRLPFSDSAFTCAVMTGVFGFLPDPVVALSEVARVLRTGGRLVMFTSSKELKGTAAAPEPMASRLRFYEDGELLELARSAGFSSARVERPDLQRYAEEEKEIPKEALGLFSGRGGQLLVAKKEVIVVA